MRKQPFLIFFLLAAELAAAGAGRPQEVVGNGQSPFVIYHEAGAPESVRRAAREIQNVIRQASDVELPIVQKPGRPMIALGEIPQARAAGIGSLPEEHFVILANDGDIFLAGQDTPDGGSTWGTTNGRGKSQGTLWAAYEFLERLTGVRWLMPGTVGEEVPRARRLVWPGGEIRKGPAFPYRDLAYVRETAPGREGLPEVNEWLLRMRTGGSRLIAVQHSWPDYVSQEVLQAHPEFLAVNGDPDKYNTSNPALVKEFAKGVIAAIRRSPHDRYYSISPSDGGGFSRDPDTLKLVEKDPHGYPSYSRVILKFYNDVARLVGQEFPDKMLAGYVYYNYMYPPSEAVTLERNLHLQWAALEYYGFGLYKPEYENEFAATAEKWKAVANGNLSYTSYSHFFRNPHGAPVPPGFGILETELPVLQRLGAQGVFLAGNSAWGTGALLNYLLARQMWDPGLNVREETRTWLKLAYGPGWKSMEELYDLLDQAFRKHKAAETSRRNYEITFDVIRSVYLPLLPRIEALYAQGRGAAETEKQRERLEMFADNLRLFRQLLRQAGLTISPSPLDLPEAEEDAYRARTAGAYWMSPDIKPIWVPELRKVTLPCLPEKSAAPRVDGKADDAAWQNAAQAKDFRVAGTGKPGRFSTEARLLHDKDALYVLFVSEVPPDMKAGASLSKDDARIYHGSNIGLFLEAEDGKWWHFTTDAANNQWDGRNDQPEYTVDWESASRIADGRWVAELRIPLAALGPGKTPGSWRANLVRQQRFPGRENSSSENTAWNSVEEHFAQPAQFGVWVFAQNHQIP